MHEKSLLPEKAISDAIEFLGENDKTQDAIEVLKGIRAGNEYFAISEQLRGVGFFKLRKYKNAKLHFISAVENGAYYENILENLSRLAVLTELDPASANSILLVLANLKNDVRNQATVQLFSTLKFNSLGNLEDKIKTFELLVFPLIEWATNEGRMDYALSLEDYVYLHLVKSEETERNFSRVAGRIASHMNNVGARIRENLPQLPIPVEAPSPKVGFFIHTASMLAHVEVLLNMLKGYRQLAEQPFNPVIYCLSGKDAAMELAFAELNIEIVMLNERFPETSKSIWNRLLRFRELLSQDGVKQIVWVSVVMFMGLVFGMRFAEVQTWWAMKYHSIDFPDIDGYVTGGAITKYRYIDGRKWRNGILGVDDWYDSSVETKALDIRARFENYTILGTMAREVKMRDPEFLRSIVYLLNENENAVYLWAGESKHAEIQQVFDAGGVSDRTVFIGWVETRLYAQVIDIFLDTFPFPCGFTLFQAMAAGKPPVISATRESAETGLWAFLEPVLDADYEDQEQRKELIQLLSWNGINLLPAARRPDEFVEFADKLIKDENLRLRAGKAAQSLMQRYFSNTAQMGKTYSQHFIELMDGS